MIGWLVSMKLPLEQNFMAIGIAGLVGTIAVTLINHRLAAGSQHIAAPESQQRDVVAAGSWGGERRARRV